MKKLFLLFLLLSSSLIGCKEKCADVNCLNGGVCNDGTCTCPIGYDGEFCQDEARTKFLGNYSVHEEISSSSGNTSKDYTCSIVTNGTDKFAIKFTNLYNYSSCPNGNNEVEATVSGNNITIANQPLCWPNTEGSGSINGTTITLNYTNTLSGAPGYPQTIVATFTRQ